MAIDWHKEPLTLQTKITSSYKTTQNIRRFFKQHAGTEVHFSRAFMQWMKTNTGKTLEEAIAHYRCTFGKS